MQPLPKSDTLELLFHKHILYVCASSGNIQKLGQNNPIFFIQICTQLCFAYTVASPMSATKSLMYGKGLLLLSFFVYTSAKVQTQSELWLLA